MTKASLHNPTVAAALRLRVGDRVVVKRAGDVIPQVHGAGGGGSHFPPLPPVKRRASKLSLPLCQSQPPLCFPHLLLRSCASSATCPRPLHRRRRRLHLIRSGRHRAPPEHPRPREPANGWPPPPALSAGGQSGRQLLQLLRGKNRSVTPAGRRRLAKRTRRPTRLLPPHFRGPP